MEDEEEYELNDDEGMVERIMSLATETKQPVDTDFDEAVAKVFNILNIGPNQGRVVISLLNLAYFRGKRDAFKELKSIIGG